MSAQAADAAAPNACLLLSLPGNEPGLVVLNSE